MTNPIRTIARVAHDNREQLNGLPLKMKLLD